MEESSTESSIEAIIEQAESSLTKSLLLKTVESTMCPICHDHMHVPFMTKCGHNFCYGCITEWLDTNITCPACRSEVSDEPYLNVSIQDTMSTIIELCQKITGEKLLSVDTDRRSKMNEFKKDNQRNRRFRSIFQNSGLAVVDRADGVARCSNCHWEVHGNRCLNCNINLRTSPVLDEISDPDTDLDAESMLRAIGADDGSSDDDDDHYRLRPDDDPDEDDLAFINDEDEEEDDDHDYSEEDTTFDDDSIRNPHERRAPLGWMRRQQGGTRIPYSDDDDDDDDEEFTYQGRNTTGRRVVINNNSDSDLSDLSDEGNMVNTDGNPIPNPSAARYVPTFVSDDEPWEDRPDDLSSGNDEESWNGFSQHRLDDSDDDIHEDTLNNISEPTDTSDEEPDMTSPRRRRLRVFSESEDDE